MDADNQIVQTIDPAWAKDANGNEVDTYYEIKGDELVQVVNFDEDTAFPVVADPTSHPNKKSYYYLTKEGVKQLRDSFTELSYSTFYGGLVTCAAYRVQPVAGVCSTLIFANQLYSGYKYYTWNKVYKNFEKRYAKVEVTHKWRNGGKNSGYIASGEKVTYVWTN